MIPVDFEGSNKVYTKPNGWEDEQCGDLHTLETKDSYGNNIIVSAWMPNKEDIEAINAGRPVYLTLVFPVQVPVELFTLDEKGNSNNQ